MPRRNPSTPISLRAAILGLILSALVSLWGEYAANRLGYEPTATQLPAVLLLPFLVLIVAPNLIVKSLAPHRALARSELIVIFSMGLVASMVPDQAMTKYLLVVVTAPHYFASPENRWVEQFFAYLPDWLVLSNEHGAARMFFEGMPPSQSIPWSAWVVPLFWWCSLIAALMCVGACLVVMLRKQWVDYDRLRFPLGEVSLHLMGTEEDPLRPGEPGLFRMRMFRVGWWLILGVMLWNIVSFWGLWPHVPMMASDSTLLTLNPAFPSLVIRLNLFVFCFFFFVNTEILFSLWVFLLLYILQAGILNRLGFISTSGTIVPGGLVSIQSIGGLIMFVLWGLWMARRHVREVWRKAMGRASHLDDDDELFSYRTAVLGLIVGMFYITCWLHSVGLSIPIILLFLFFLFIFYLTMARVVAEAGLVSVDLPVNAHQFTIGIVGSASLLRPDLTALGLTNAFARNWRTFTMIGLSHMAWLREYIGLDRRHLFRWCCLAFWVSAFTSVGYVIYAGYTFGAQNLRTDLGTDRGVRFYDLISQWINNATRVSEVEVLFFASGVVVMLLITAARYVLYWWPLHPIGMVVVASAPIGNAFLPIFLAWLIQTILLRIGGGRLYRKAQPLFIGILTGYLVGQGLSMLIDSLWFPDSPHPYEVY